MSEEIKPELEMRGELRSLLDKRKPIGFYVYANWVFSKWYEKVGLIAMIGLGTWKIIEVVILR